MAIARLSGGPLDGQVLPLDNESDDTLIMPYSEGQLVYRREGEGWRVGRLAPSNWISRRLAGPFAARRRPPRLLHLPFSSCADGRDD